MQVPEQAFVMVYYIYRTLVLFCQDPIFSVYSYSCIKEHIPKTGQKSISPSAQLCYNTKTYQPFIIHN